VVALYAVCTAWGLALAMNDAWLRTILTSSRHVLTPQSLPWLMGYVLLPAILLMPPNILIGACFPIAQKAVHNDPNRVGQRVALLQLASIIGNVSGCLGTGLILLQYIGTPEALRLISLLGLCLILPAIRQKSESSPLLRRLLPVCIASALGLAVLFSPSSVFFWRHIHQASSNDFFAVTEDSSGVATVMASENFGRLHMNGEFQGSIPYYDIHTLLGALPALLHPNPKEVMVIGIGSTGTAHAAGINPLTERIIAIEIINAELPVLQAYAKTPNGKPIKDFFEDSRLTIIQGDGRQELRRCGSGFDIIQADAVFPWRSGAGLLYSREFFQQEKNCLKENGIAVQWAPTKRVEKTFASVFPYVLLLDSSILLGSSQPITLDIAKLRHRLATDLQIQRSMEKARFSLNLDQLSVQKSWTPDSPHLLTDLNSDLFPRDEYYLNND